MFYRVPDVFLCKRVMVDSDISGLSSETDEECDNSLWLSSSSEYSEEVDLSLPSSEVEAQPYRFKPELPATDIDDGRSSEEVNSAEILPMIELETLNGKFIDNVSCSPAWLSLFHCGELRTLGSAVMNCCMYEFQGARVVIARRSQRKGNPFAIKRLSK